MTMASDLQTVGRARRYCSHAALPTQDWTVEIHRYFSDTPSIDEKVNVTSGTSEFETLTTEISTLEYKLSEVTDKKEKALLKSQIKEANAKLKSLAIQQKKIDKSKQDMSVTMIDKMIYENAQLRMRDLFTVYHSMKEAAVDCLLLQDFHNNPEIKCMDSQNK